MAVKRSRAALMIALLIFLVFFANVALGGAGFPTFLSDLGGAVTLFAAVSAFVVGILNAEAARNAAER